jgi:hypothetical protein
MFDIQAATCGTTTPQDWLSIIARWHLKAWKPKCSRRILAVSVVRLPQVAPASRQLQAIVQISAPTNNISAHAGKARDSTDISTNPGGVASTSSSTSGTGQAPAAAAAAAAVAAASPFPLLQQRQQFLRKLAQLPDPLPTASVAARAEANPVSCVLARQHLQTTLVRMPSTVQTVQTPPQTLDS